MRSRRLAAAIQIATLSSVLVGRQAVAQSTETWAVTGGPIVVMPGVDDCGSGAVLGVAARASKVGLNRGPFFLNAAVRAHAGLVAAAGECVTVVRPGAVWPPPTHGLVPLAIAVGPDLEYRWRMVRSDWTVRAFGAATLGYFGSARSAGESDGAFVGLQAGAALAVKLNRLIIAFEASQLGWVRDTRPRLWTLQFGSAW